MSQWVEKIDIRGILKEYEPQDDDEEAPDDVKERLAAEVRKSRHLAYMADRFTDCYSIADIDDVLEEVYQVADARRVWTG